MILITELVTDSMIKNLPSAVRTLSADQKFSPLQDQPHAELYYV